MLQLEPRIENVISPIRHQKLEWNGEMEGEFNRFRSSAQKRMIREIKSSSWNLQGIYPLIREIWKSQIGKSQWPQQREEKFKRYSNGDVLSEGEMQFIANTSMLLNANSDKEFIQKAVNYVEKEIIEDIELKIAENVLEQFSRMEADVMEAREAWLERKNLKNRRKIERDGAKLRRKAEVEQKQVQLVRIKNKLIAVLKEIERRNTLREEERAKKLRAMNRKRKQGDPLYNKYVLKFKDIMMMVVKAYRIRHTARKLDVSEQFLSRNRPRQPAKELFVVRREPRSVEVTHPSP